MVVLYVVVLSITFGRFDGLFCLCVLHVVCFVLVCMGSVLFWYALRSKFILF